MASVFTFDPDPPRVSSPWLTPAPSTPQLATAQLAAANGEGNRSATEDERGITNIQPPVLLAGALTKLEAEPQEGATEYKLHLLLRPRRSFNFTSTGQQVSGSYHSKLRFPSSNNVPDVTESSQRVVQAPSNQTRQHRLQQLTTQLLWRLQQSSPYHSSSAADLVLPVLPEATPHLDAPKTPARLLAGLEESQGALYEIGVSDDGTFVGLAPDEMDESLTNLRAMAASLGCRVQILRRVPVGTCQYPENESLSNGPSTLRTETLWVAEALVKPDFDLDRDRFEVGTSNHAANGSLPSPVATHDHGYTSKVQSYTEQIRISVTGSTTSGKSSLVGTLSTSTLDNGRGKSRLSLLKHRHEIASGITSSVAQELVGYSAKSYTPDMAADVVNYASGNVSSWNDIHAGASGGRLTFISDSAGHPRFQKTILRSLMSWDPHWTLLCVAADDCEDNAGKAGATATTQDVLGSMATGVDLSLAHLELCVALNLPLVLVITKLDLASRTGLRLTLAKVLSALKAAGKKPLMLSTPSEPTEHGLNLQHVSSADEKESAALVTALSNGLHSIVPIIFTSAVTGSGIGKIHSLLRILPIPAAGTHSLPFVGDWSMEKDGSTPVTLFPIDEVYEIPPSKVYAPSKEAQAGISSGVILSGHLRQGTLQIGDELIVGPVLLDGTFDSALTGSMHGSSSLPDRGKSLSLPQVDSSPKQRQRHLSGDGRPMITGAESRHRAEPYARGTWLNVRVVSIRNLRLPVWKLLAGQAGTIGIELSPILPASSSLSSIPLSSPSDTTLFRIRRGNILADFGSLTSLAPIYCGVVICFPSNPSDLTPGTPVTVYIASIRASARVCEAKVEPSDLVKQPARVHDSAIFSFDDSDSDPGSDLDMTRAVVPAETRRTFSFVSLPEWFEIGTQALVIPAAASGFVTTGGTGLEGIVGRVVEGLR